MVPMGPLTNIVKNAAVFQLMAAMDYVLVTKPSHELALLRKGTILTRYDGMHIVLQFEYWRPYLHNN